MKHISHATQQSIQCTTISLATRHLHFHSVHTAQHLNVSQAAGHAGGADNEEEIQMLCVVLCAHSSLR